VCPFKLNIYKKIAGFLIYTEWKAGKGPKVIIQKVLPNNTPVPNNDFCPDPDHDPAF
jgi:hypothetical protein